MRREKKNKTEYRQARGCPRVCETFTLLSCQVKRYLIGESWSATTRYPPPPVGLVPLFRFDPIVPPLLFASAPDIARPPAASTPAIAFAILRCTSLPEIKYKQHAQAFDEARQGREQQVVLAAAE